MLLLHFYIIFAIDIVLATVAVIAHFRDRSEDRFGAFVTKVVVIPFVAVSVLILAPFQPKYWFITQHTGVVTDIETRSAGYEDDVLTTFNVAIDTMEDRILSTDARFLSVHEGDTVTVACTLEWIYGAKDKINCTISE